MWTVWWLGSSWLWFSIVFIGSHNSEECSPGVTVNHEFIFGNCIEHFFFWLSLVWTCNDWAVLCNESTSCNMQYILLVIERCLMRKKRLKCWQHSYPNSCSISLEGDLIVSLLELRLPQVWMTSSPTSWSLLDWLPWENIDFCSELNLQLLADLI